NTSPGQMCSSMCPASQTQIFYGNSIDSASAPGVGAYTNLRNAFIFRKQLVPNCTCNGKDAFGLVTLDVNADPTLRAGDLIGTKDGTGKPASGRAAYAAAESGGIVADPDVAGGQAVRVIPARPGPPPSFQQQPQVQQQPPPQPPPQQQQRGFNLFRLF